MVCGPRVAPFQQSNQHIGILSLARVKDSLLRWSHYVDQYAGAVVGFDGFHEFFAGQIDVEYRSTRATPSRP